MNFNNLTIKSQEAIQQAQLFAQSMEHQQIENEHIFKAISEIDENVLPYIYHQQGFLGLGPFIEHNVKYMYPIQINCNLIKVLVINIQDIG